MIELPSSDEAEGCIQCQMGSKLVLFVTGHCHWMCDYCPLSENRREIDYMYANERRVDIDDWAAVLEEGRAMNATGTGITGGDPMMAAERSMEACRRLKAEFGPSHHIHLYTSIPFKPEVAQVLADAGLDEIRFHLLDLDYQRYVATMDACRNAGLMVGVELPCEPDKEERLFELIEEMRNGPVLFLNLNELEITVGNYDNMEVRGFNLSDEITAGAKGSAELARSLHAKVTDEYGYMVKFCTASYKDSGQLRRRFLRRGEATIAPHEQLTEDGTLIFGAIYCSPEDGEDWIDEIQEQTDIPPQFLYHDKDNDRIEIPLLLAEGIAEDVEAPVAMVEVHPTHERLEVSLVWLNSMRPE
ncbi:MAG: radical SAM protein [Candidatus Thalassarchaeaceae archaeon]|nr:radical SAM protein [Candidatus Thalassarchaeaceae archaeon]